MSDINALYTQQARSAANSAISGKPDQAAAGTGVNFFDMIFANLAVEQTTPITAPTTQESTANPANDLMAVIASAIPLDGETELDMEILPEGDLQGQGLTNITLDSAGMKKLQATLDTLLEGIPADQRPVALNISGDQLKAALKKLGISAEDIEANSQSLIATGLSPEDLTKLMQMISQGPDEAALNESADIQAMLIGTIKLVPDGETTQTIFLPKTIMFSKNGEAKPADTAEEISASLTALSGNASTDAGTEISAEGTKTIREARFDDILKMLELSQGKASEARGGAALGAHGAAGTDATPAADTTGKPGPSNSTVAANIAGLFGSFVNNNAAGDVFPEGLDWSQNNAAISNSQVSGPAQLTSLVTHARDATQPHPASQFVAATLAKGAKDGETKNMTLRMDPPDLGKIEIHMQFTKNKEIKTHMVFEKPETMLMMQRDSQMLERSLQESGLDGNALSFELASQDHDFENSRGQNGNEYGKNSKDAADDMELIETTMNWTVDQNTGLQHYNILA